MSALRGHPKGLYLLFAMSTAERFSSIGLSMVNKLRHVEWALSGGRKGEVTLRLSDCQHVRLLYGIRRYVGRCLTDSLPSFEEIAKDDARSGIKIVFLPQLF